MNLLIPYVKLYKHPDPLFEEFTYGDGGSRGRKLKNDLIKGDYVFFHTSRRGKKVITAYYVVDRVLDTIKAINDKNIKVKYKNPHMKEMINGTVKHTEENAIVFGDPITSKVLDRPLVFDKPLAKRLSLKINFPEGKTETQVIGSATRPWRKLTKNDVNILLQEIQKWEAKVGPVKQVLSSQEVSEFVEKHIEDILSKQPDLIGKDLKLEGRQLVTDDGRIDLLFEDLKDNKIVVEVKLGRIGRSAVEQTKRYMKWLKKDIKKKVSGVIVCEGVMPAFEEDLKNLKDIKIFCYGWQLKIFPWEKNI
jgi:hypothetical protein